VLNDALSIYFGDATLASAFVAVVHRQTADGVFQVNPVREYRRAEAAPTAVG